MLYKYPQSPARPPNASDVATARLTIAAIMPVYRRPRIVLDALDSVASQTRPPDVLIVVDDGSPGATPRVVREWMEREPRPFVTKLVEGPNTGAAAARNRACAHARDCNVFAFLDSDDMWRPHHLATLEAALLDNPSAIAASNGQEVVGPDGERELKEFESYTGPLTEKLFCDGPTGTSATAVRADAFWRVRGFDPEIMTGEDLHLMLRLSLLGPWICLPGVHVTYRDALRDTHDEEGSLGRKYADRRVKRAYTLDRFIFEEGGRAEISETVWRRRLSAKWYAAGRHLRITERPEQGLEAFRRSLELSPWNLRARLGLWRCRFETPTTAPSRQPDVS